MFNFLNRIIKTKKRVKIVTSNKIWINDFVGFNPEGTRRVLVQGKTGGGKTYLSFIIANQYPNVIYFDTKGIGKQSAVKTLKEQKILKEWKLTHVNRRGRKKNRLSINVREIGSNAINYIARTTSANDLKKRRALTPLLEKSDDNPTKNFAHLQEILFANKLDFFLEDLKSFVNEKDEGVSLSELLKGKWIINTYGYPMQNDAIGFFVGAILDYKVTNFPEESLLIVADDVQMYATANTSLGRAMSTVATTGRSYGVSMLMIGTNVSKIDPKIKANSEIHCVFRSNYSVDEFKKMFGIDMPYEVDVNKLKDQYFMFYSADDGFDPAIVTRANQYYKVLLEKENLFVDEEGGGSVGGVSTKYLRL